MAKNTCDKNKKESGFRKSSTSSPYKSPAVTSVLLDNEQTLLVACRVNSPAWMSGLDICLQTGGTGDGWCTNSVRAGRYASDAAAVTGAIETAPS